ncbi:MAG: toluene tolerance protein [Gammaproteobacteria bacterium]|nr:MAG: toluene tolerance protein [Gammaproteobacteria bacterium]
MKKLSKDEYATLRDGATVIEADAYGDKVLFLADGTYLKLFRVKRLISTARFYPYSKRFVKNAARLADKDIPTVTVIGTYKISSVGRTAVRYYPLTGKSLRKLGNLDIVIASKLGNFIRELHDKGIYFRSLHLGNIIITQENRLGLIDLADMKIYKHPLTDKLRLRNFQHCARYQEDKLLLGPFLNVFLRGYFVTTEKVELRQKIEDIFHPIKHTD